LLPELAKLIDVQGLDREIQEIATELEKLPQDLKATEAALEELKAERAGHLQEVENLQNQRRETEAEMAEMEDGITKSRQRLMEIKSNIEYKAMLKEIAFKEDQRDQRETRTIELMEQMGTHNQAVADGESRMEEMEKDIEQQCQAVAEQVAKLEKELAQLQEQRKKFRKGVPAQLLKRYEFIRQRRNGTAIAQVVEGVCMGCHMNILPQQFIDLQKGLEILQCPHCQRILFWSPEPEEEEGSQQVS
jgi:uncharacterized protein